ncbi:MAG: heme lyase CcmF/NrfE family subunit [Alphaproteobacteria bacterium]|nr:heme lyase CcmF/NrfE family subunit [Alphaproteobacteria bacterium]
MIAQAGQDILFITLLLALTTSICGFIAKEHTLLSRITRYGSITVCAAISISFALLIFAFVISDFSVITVYQNSHTLKPLLYKITGVWGNHEGSMILWVLVASFFGAVLSIVRTGLSSTMITRILATQALMVTGFLAFIVFTSNPFVQLSPAPAEGLGLNPLLQDPALAFHPPMLYLGYVGFSLAFSFAIAALLTGEVTREWAKALRPFVMVAWCALTIGIAMGSWWAYYELGWGGWWFWDPVENASFIPWLSGTALLHSLIVVEKRGTLKTWTVLLGLITFTFSMIGTFLVRSGIVTSVHAFALDPERGIFVLLLIGLSAGFGLLLFALRGHRFTSEQHFAPISRESFLVINNLFLVAAAATVLLGTLYPLIYELINDAQISVGPPYFEASFTPLMMPLIFLMGFAPFLAWRHDELKRIFPRLQVCFLTSCAIVVLVMLNHQQQALRFYLGIGFVTWLLSSTILGFIKNQKQDLLQKLPISLAHGGLAIALCGMVASSHLSTEAIDLMKPGSELKLNQMTFYFDKVEHLTGPNYVSERATFHVTDDKGLITTLNPERRFYPVGKKMLSDVAIYTNGFSDLYLVLGEPQKNPDGSVKGWTVRATAHPLIPWIWVGCLIMALGGLAALIQMQRQSRYSDA